MFTWGDDVEDHFANGQVKRVQSEDQKFQKPNQIHDYE